MTRRSRTRRRAAAASPSSMATRASCSIAATPSSNWPRRARSSTSPTCCSTANCRPAPSTTSGPSSWPPSQACPRRQRTFSSGFQRDAHSMGVFLSLVGALSTYYPDAKHVENVGDRLRQIRRLIAQVPDRRRVGVSAPRGTAARRAGQRPDLHGQLPADALSQGLQGLQARSGARARSRGAVHPARRPRAELQHERDARHRQFAGRPVLGPGRRGRRAVRPAPRRRQRSRAPDAAGDRLGQPRARIHQQSEASSTAG